MPRPWTIRAAVSGLLLFVLLFPVVKLGQDFLELFGDREPQVDGILQDGQALIAEVEAHGCTAQGAASA